MRAVLTAGSGAIAISLYSAFGRRAEEPVEGASLNHAGL